MEDVATPEAWAKDPETVLKFYNERRRQLYTVAPNAAHKALANLETTHDVTVITQNVDNLHERGGSSRVIHLHGELDTARSTTDPNLVQALEGRDIKLGDKAEDGSQLRPNIVWFGEAVPKIEQAAAITATTDILIVIGTSLVVYPAASLAYLAPDDAEKYLVNPVIPEETRAYDFELIEAMAAEAVPDLVERLQAGEPD